MIATLATETTSLKERNPGWKGRWPGVVLLMGLVLKISN